MPTIRKLRSFILSRIETALRRGPVYSPIQLYIGAYHDILAHLDGKNEQQWAIEFKRLQEQGRFSPLGLEGPFLKHFRPREIRQFTFFESESASVLAEVMHRLGYLKLDRLLTTVEFQELLSDLPRYRRGEWRANNVKQRHGTASITTGNCYCYASESPALGWIFFDFAFDPVGYPSYKPGSKASQGWATVEGRRYSDHPDSVHPLLRNVRFPAAIFEDGLIITQYGRRIQKARRSHRKHSADPEANS